MSTIESPVTSVKPETITPDKIHPFANLFPGLNGERFAELRADIKARGQVEPVVFHNGVLLDGRNRALACKDLGINVRAIDFRSLGLTCTPEEYIESANLFRRHLTEDQRAMVALKFADALAAAAKEQQKRKPAGNSVLVDSPKQKPLHTRKVIAEKAKVSENKVRQAQEVKKRAPHLVPQVESGEMKLKDAAAQVATVPKKPYFSHEQPPVKAVTAAEVVATPAPVNPAAELWIHLQGIKETGPVNRRRYFSEGAELFADRLIETMKERGLLPLFDSQGNELTFEVVKHSFFVRRKAKAKAEAAR